MLTLPNLLSVLRIPLAFVFLQENLIYRIIALLLAVITDVADGYIARNYNQKSRFGALIDPLADKFFVLFVLIVLISEQRLTLEESVMMISRDCAVCLFGFYLVLSDNFKKYEFRSIWSGKVTTSFQFGTILALICHFQIPSEWYLIFVILGIVALAELSIRKNQFNTEYK